jgi:tRNA-specific adenosine deaminase 3
MGLLLSRFRAVVYPQRGRMVTGGLASEPVPVVGPVCVEDSDVRMTAGEVPRDDEDTQRQKPSRLYYGLHWRKELNWRALGFEFVEESVEKGAVTLADEGLAFYA